MIHVIGDVLVDHTIDGSVTRISPEAPTPVVLQQHAVYGLGGAGNVWMNCLSLGGSAFLYAVMDQSAVSLTRSNGCSAYAMAIVSQSYRTPIKTRIRSDGVQLLRVDTEGQAGPVPRHEVQQLLQAFEHNLQQYPGIVVVSDYAKGLFDAESASAVLHLARARGCPVFVDAKPKQLAAWAGAALCTPNRQEAIAVATADNYVHPAMYGNDTGDAALAAAQHLVERYKFLQVVLTQGADGAAVVQPYEKVALREYKAEPIRVYDVTGAGDTFLAALAVGAASGLDVHAATSRAVWAGCLAVQQHGVAVVTEEQWHDAMREDVGPEGKILVGDAAVALAAQKQRYGRRVVLTNGCFDVVHSGHLHTLHAAKSHGDFLMVAVDTDASVRRLKGEGRPMTAEKQRLLQIATLPMVDAVFLFDGDTEAMVQRVRPQVLVKGHDYGDKPVLGADWVKANGGLVVVVPAPPEVSALSTTRWLTS